MKTRIRPFPVRVAEAAKGIGGLLRDARDHRRRPVNDLTEHGFEIVPDFLDAGECERLVGVARELVRNESYVIDGESYFLRRGLDGVDTGVSQIMNAQDMDQGIADLAEEGTIPELFSERLGEEIVAESYTIQIDHPDARTKRGFHVDRLSPPSFKAFVYLTDAPDERYGPYTVVAGSHRHWFRKITNAAYNAVIGNPVTDQRLFYDEERETAVAGRAGTLILSNQQLAHRGGSKHTIGVRHVLIVYLAPARFTSRAPFRLGRHLIDDDGRRRSAS